MRYLLGEEPRAVRAAFMVRTGRAKVDLDKRAYTRRYFDSREREEKSQNSG